MPEILLDGRGTGDTAGVTSGNRLMTDSTISETIPTDGTKNNPAETYIYSGAGVIGSINRFIGSSQFVQVITYSGPNDVVTSIGSWVGV